ncbi:DUF5701 family protein [Vreelandella nigrificans]|uniref:Uncharacterized protein n=1 Tax=Vreelandella nigrificans TaxID=2042704 RepID=A0A2A4HR03_9GAMM|nr:DUF5701 family protein [Halomonas nigrificans]PCF97362.1 hypothetical protein CPA45_01060 [Halomonas nigrificans]
MLSDPVAEFDRQVDVLFQRIRNNVFKYDLSKFQQQTAELRPRICDLDTAQDVREGNIPVVIVFRIQVASYDNLLCQLHHKGREGYIEMTPKTPESFVDIDSLAVSEADIYALWDVDTGGSMLNISPSDSVDMLESKGRTPLTMYEGVQCVLAIPEILTDKQRFNAIQMPGSRIGGDQRVPSIWISKGAPRLGWCWFGNIHTWLATASCKSRVQGG